MNLRNKNVTFNGKTYAILAGKSTSIDNRSIYLLNALGEEPDYSLWLVEVDNYEKKMSLWPYEGTDTEELIKQLLEEFLETAFE